MTKDKVTITLDRTKAGEAQRLSGAASVSATVDAALDALIRAERLRRDLEAYGATGPTEEERDLVAARPASVELADDTDWSALYEDA